MEVQGLPLDMISNLPSKIIQKILTFMPIQDAFRTRILSQSWRDQCLNIPKLKFHDSMFQRPAYNTLSVKYKLLRVVYPILVLHQGPILEFSLCFSQLDSCCEIDQIIVYLSRNATLKKFTLCVGIDDEHRLLPSFFELQQLTVLHLENCAFQLPATFKGFGMLVSLAFVNVNIILEDLMTFISGCPLLKDFTLIGTHKYVLSCENSGYMELFECLPLIEHLCINGYQIKNLANSQDYSGYSSGILSHLRVLKITNFYGLKSEMDLVELVLKRSLVLKKVYIVIDQYVDIRYQVKMLKELLQLPRASAKVEIWFSRASGRAENMFDLP